MLNPAVFLDRDGTINIDTGYVSSPDSVRIYPDVAEGIKLLKKKCAFKIIVISNQAGIAYGLMTNEDVSSVNNKINELLKREGAEIDAFYYCPYHPDYNTEDESKCRKPSPYMIVQAKKDYNIDISKSYMVGDKGTDVLCGINAGVKTVLLNYDFNREEINSLQKQGKNPNFVAANFKEACQYIVNDFLEANN